MFKRKYFQKITQKVDGKEFIIIPVVYTEGFKRKDIEEVEKDFVDMAQFLIQRNAALEAFDMDWARVQMPTASNDYVREIAMHKARYDCTAVSNEARLVSAQWLRERDLKRMNMSPLLPIGELPE